MADQKAPGYELDDTLDLKTAEQHRALFEATRLRIVDLLLERAATIKDLATALDRPKGTIGHHVNVLEDAGLIRVVRTEKVRAIEAKYYGRTARTYLIDDPRSVGFELAPDYFISTAASEFTAVEKGGVGHISTLRYARIPDTRADEWVKRLADLATEFTAEQRGGETTFGLLLAMYPTERRHLPDERGGEG